MAEFKIGLGIEILPEARQKVQTFIDEFKTNSNNKIQLDIDTQKPLSKIKELQREINKLKNTRIVIDNTSASRGYGNTRGGSYDKLLGMTKEMATIQSKLGTLDVSKNANQVSALNTRLEKLIHSYKELYEVSKSNLSSEQLGKLSEPLYRAKDAINEYKAKLQDLNNQKFNQLKLNFDNGEYSAKLEKAKLAMNGLSVVSNDLKNDFAQLISLHSSMSASFADGNVDKAIADYNEFNSVLKRLNNNISATKSANKINANDSALSLDRQRLSNNIDLWLQKNSASASEFGARLENIKSQIASADKVRLGQLQKEFGIVKQEAEKAGKAGLTFGDSLKKQMSMLRNYFSLFTMFNYARRAFTSMFNEVKKIDTAMSGLYRVTDLTANQYSEMYDKMASSAKEYGLVLSELIDGATTWAKLGFSGTKASDLAEISGRYQVVADTDTETAVNNLVTGYKAFENQLLNLYGGDSVKAVEYISDIFNKLGNEYAIDAESVGVALTKSASALQVAGNDIQQASGMITGIAEKTGNAERGSNALKILSLRLRGMTGELEALGEEVDENVESISSMQTKILNMTSGKVNIFEDDGSFRSTYDIMKDISEIYYDLSDVDKANLLETIAGKFLPEYTEMCI